MGETLPGAEKEAALSESEKLLDTFLEHRAISQEQFDIEIDRARLSNQISYFRNHADWINNRNRMAFLAKSVQKAIQISEATKESLSPIVQEQGVAE